MGTDLARCVLVFVLLGFALGAPAAGQDASQTGDDAPGIDLRSFASLDLLGGNGGGADAYAPGAPPAGEAKAEDIKSPTLRALVAKGLLTSDDAIKADKEEEARRGKPVNTLVDSISFGGESYLGYTYTTRDHVGAGAGKDTGEFEARRNYINLIANLTPNLLFRNTVDLARDAGTGNLTLRYKYAYLRFKEIVKGSHTGLEFGIVHRPWVAHEENQSWLYRSIAQVFVENAESAGLMGSADLGLNVNPAFPYLSAELGLFNGEGYDHIADRSGGQFFANSAEGRVTAHLLGNGDKKVNAYKDTYLNASFITVNNFNMNAGAAATVLGSTLNANGKLDRYVLMGHIVYNQPALLLAAQYVHNQDHYDSNFTFGGASHNNDADNYGFSFNGEFRPLFLFSNLSPEIQAKVAIFGRGDFWYTDDFYQDDRRVYIYGLAYRLNQYVRLIVNGITVDHREGNVAVAGVPANISTGVTDANSVMFTTEVNW